MVDQGYDSADAISGHVQCLFQGGDPRANPRSKMYDIIIRKLYIVMP